MSKSNIPRAAGGDAPSREGPLSPDRLRVLLARSERQFRSVAQSTHDAIVVVDSRRNVVLWNEGAARMFGWSPRQIVGRPLSMIMPTSFRDDHDRAMDRVVQSGKSKMAGQMVECTGLRRDGTQFPIEFSVSSWSTNGDRYFTGIVRDITRRKQAEGELLAHRGQLEALVASRTAELEQRNAQLQAEIARRQVAQTELTRANRTLQMLSECNQTLIKATAEKKLLSKICRLIVQLGGYRMAWVGLAQDDRRKSVAPVAWRGLVRGYMEKLQVTWADRPRGRGPTGTAIRTGEPVVIRDIADPRFAPWRADAQRRGYASVVALPLKSGGDRLGALTIYSPEADAFDAPELRLLTELADDLAFGLVTLRSRARREQAERALHESEQRLRAVLGSLHETVVLVLDADGRYVSAWADASSQKRYGIDFAQLTGKSVHDVLGAAQGDERVALIREVMASGQSRRIDATVSLPGGQFILDESFSPMADRRGRPVAVVAVYRDITERKRSEQSIQQLNRRLMNAREDEQRRVARELHDSFGQELLGLRLAVQNVVDGQGEVPPAVREALGRVGEKIQQLSRDIRNMCYGLYPISLEAFGLAPALRQMAHDVRSAVPVRFSHGPDLDGARFSTDTEIALFRIAQEAVNNAAKYSKGGKVQVELSRQEGRIRLQIVDDGVGFDAGKVRQGLGLTTMRERALAIGGELRMTSRPGRTAIEALVPALPREE